MYKNTIVWDYGTISGNDYVALTKFYFSPQVSSFNLNLQLATVTISGINFGEQSEDSRVELSDGRALRVDSWSDTVIICRVPNLGGGRLKVVTKGGQSNEMIFDSTAPRGSILIGRQDNQAPAKAAYTKSTDVKLFVSAEDNISSFSDIQMQFFNDGKTYTRFELYQDSKLWQLSAGDGNKTVYVRFKDAAGNISEAVSDEIILDTVVPQAAVNVEYLSDGKAKVSLTAADSGSGVDKIYFSVDGSKPAILYGGRSLTIPASCIIKYYSVDKAGNEEPVQTKELVVPRINSTSPDLPVFGSCANPITITGSGFGARQGRGKVLFDGSAEANITSWSDSEIIINFGKVTGDLEQGFSFGTIINPDIKVPHTLTVINDSGAISQASSFSFHPNKMCSAEA